MFDVSAYINTGILELYALGIASNEECHEVERMALEHAEIRTEIEKIKASLELYADAYSLQPNEVLKPFLMATIDYTERLKKGEPASAPPILSENSTVTDFDQWLQRPDMLSGGSADVFAKIIGYTREAITAIVWLKDYAPHEVHDNEYERFLVVEGSCDIIVEDQVNHLVPGNYFAIPLHKKHMVKVTSTTPCKVILQRIAA